MAKNLTQKIIEAHLAGGRMATGEEIALSMDQTLTQDATGTMAYLQFEALGLPRVRTKLSVSYVDHNLLQTGFESADDHRFLQSIAAKYGIYFSRPGNGISHQVHVERFAVPGSTLLGSDSHTPMAGAVGALAVGAGGLDVAVAMAGQPYHLAMPKVVLVRLTGQLNPWVAAKDIILELLRRLTVKGGVGKVLEYGGGGLATLSVPERATIANMGTEQGATSSVFPSDEQTRQFLRRQRRELDWHALAADPDAAYDEIVEVDLQALEPLMARPGSPDNVCKVSEVEGTPVAQVCVGSCNNASYLDLATLASMLNGKTVHPSVSLVVNPASRQAFNMIARDGALTELIASGARILEVGCGPCIGMGQAPPTGAVSLRTYNRNFEGRSGTRNDLVYLCSVQTASAAALTGAITDPRRLGEPPRVDLPEEVEIDDRMVLAPSPEPEV
ncbi:MAG TPA: aconitate hydratase, partial [Dehalococcoidia bacterium]|nr:aconitate hydratase [Dehalococcoidia bacterium]